MNAARRAAHRDLLLAAGALVLLLAWEGSGWDLTLIRNYGNASGFIWRDHWLTRAVLHEGGRWVAGAGLAWLILDALRPAIAGPSRNERRYWLAVVVVGLIGVPLMKRVTTTSCPWDLLEFGGPVAYVPHWNPFLTDGGPGHCFPAGHAVSAFAFFGTYFLWRTHRPWTARIVLGVTLLLGAAFTWAQMARGAHFVSHSLWSAWLCWTLSVVAQSLTRHVAPAAHTSAPETEPEPSIPGWRPVQTDRSRDSEVGRLHDR